MSRAKEFLEKINKFLEKETEVSPEIKELLRQWVRGNLGPLMKNFNSLKSELMKLPVTDTEYLYRMIILPQKMTEFWLTSHSLVLAQDTDRPWTVPGKAATDFIKTGKIKNREVLASWTSSISGLNRFIKFGSREIFSKLPDDSSNYADVIVFKKKVPISNRILSFPEIIDLFSNDKVFGNVEVVKKEMETLVLPSTLTKDDVFFIKPIVRSIKTIPKNGSPKKNIDKWFNQFKEKK